MICVGIDAAADKHDVCIIAEDGKPCMKTFTIRNSMEDYKKLLGRIQSAKELKKDDAVRIGIESTGSYSFVLLEYLERNGMEVILINPCMTRMFQMMRSIHYAKTDRIDAGGIAEFIRSGAGLRTYSSPSYHIVELKEISREIASTDNAICMSVNRIKSLLHRFFPEYLGVFSDITAAASLYILREFKDPKELINTDPESLMKTINKGSVGLITKAKTIKLIDAATNTVGNLDIYAGDVISCVAKKIEAFHEEKRGLIAIMKPLVDKEAPELLSIPGIGYLLAGGIIAEIGNFDNADQIVAYTGLDPVVYESGNYKAENTRVSKKGSSYLREMLYLASHCVGIYDPVFAAYVSKKLAEGKKYRNVMGHVSKKLCRLIMCLLKNHKNYVCPTTQAQWQKKGRQSSRVN